MKKLLLSALAISLSVCGFSQDIYQVADLSSTDLNGTARYVGMGGAMGALGGDISVMGTNPAAIGLYRRGDVAATGSLVIQPGAKKVDDKGNTHMSFDQLGFVYATPTESGYINFGVNYRKQRDLNMLVNGANNLFGASQTWQLCDLANYWDGAYNATPLTAMAYNTYLLGYDDATGEYNCYNASDYQYSKARWGSNQAFDFNVSANFNDQFYVGLTATGYNLYQKSISGYAENLLDVDGISDGSYGIFDESRLTGTGFDVKLGFLVRPVYDSNFKIGVSVTSPSYYELRRRSETGILTDFEAAKLDEDGSIVADKQGNPIYNFSDVRRQDYDYNVRTPWKLNVSMGNTFFNCLALGVEYEFADYSSCSVSYGDNFDFGGRSKDRELNRELGKRLKSTHTIKAGLEANIFNTVYLRAGYNHISSAFDKDAYSNQFINSASVDGATTTSYMNYSNVNRYTCGIGFKINRFYADFAWQYQNQHANLYPFSCDEYGSSEVPNTQNICTPSRINLNKSQILMTLGYRF